jgi:TP901 family phage tail tape measure protein
VADRTVSVHLKAVTDSYRRSMDQAAAATQKLVDRAGGLENIGSKMQSVGGVMTRSITVPMALAGGAAAKLGTDFEKAFATMTGLAGVASLDVDQLRSSVLSLAGETGRAPQELADALYFAASAGLDTAGAMEAVEVAAKGAAAGLGRTDEIVGLVASAIASYGEEAVNAAEATDILTATIRAGRADPAELAGTLGRVLPIAAQLGVGFEEVGGAVAYLSNVFGDTNRTVTAMSGLLVKLVSPSQQGRDALEEMGTSAEALKSAIDQRGLMGALELLREKGFAGNERALRSLFDDIEGYQAALALLNDRSGTLAATMAEVADSSGALDNAFGKMAETAGFKNSQAFAQLQVALIQIGDALMPLIGAASDFALAFLGAFNKLPGPVQNLVVAFGGLLAAVGPMMSIGGKLVSNWGTLTSAFDRLATGAYDALDPTKKLGTNLTNLAMKAGSYVIAGQAVAFLANAISDLTGLGASPDLSNLRGELELLARTGKEVGAVDIDRIALAIDEIIDPSTAENIGAGVSRLIDTVGQIATIGQLDVRGTAHQYSTELKAVDEILAGLVESGNAEQAARIFGQISDAVVAGGHDAEDAAAAFPGYSLALELAGARGKDAGEGAAEFGEQTEGAVPRVERLKAAVDELVAAYSATVDPFFAMEDALSGLEDAHDAVGDAQHALADAQRNVGDVSRQVASDIASAQQDVIDSAQGVEEAQLDLADAMSIVADEAEAARSGIANLASEQQAAIDPLFAMIEAVQQLEELRNKGGSNVKGTKTGDDSGKLEASDEAPATATELAKAAAGVQSAATRLAGAIATGDVSLDESRKTLALWVQQGLLTQAQADEVGKAFELAATRAERLQGANVRNAASTAVVTARQEAAEERAEAVAEAQKRLAEAMDASSQAQNRLVRAQQDGASKIQQAQRRVAEAHDDVAKAEQRVVRATHDVMTAAIALGGVMATSGTAVYAAKRQVEELGKQFGWTRDQIDAAKRKIDEAAEAARRYSGKYTATLDLDTLPFWLKWLQVQNALGADKESMPQIGPDGKFITRQSGGPIPGPRGAPVPILAHGGEFMLSADVVDAIKRGQPTAGLSMFGGSSNVDSSRVVHMNVYYPKPETVSDASQRIIRKAQLAMA